MADPSRLVRKNAHALKERIRSHVIPVLYTGRNVHQIALLAEERKNVGTTIDIEKPAAINEEACLVVRMGVLAQKLLAQLGVVRRAGVNGHHILGTKSPLLLESSDRVCVCGNDLLRGGRFRERMIGFPALKQNALLPEDGADFIEIGVFRVFVGCSRVDTKEAHATGVEWPCVSSKPFL